MAKYIDRDKLIKILSNPVTMSMCVSVSDCVAMNRQRKIDLEIVKGMPAVQWNGIRDMARQTDRESRMSASEEET